MNQKKMNTKYTKTYHEIHTSEDGEKWFARGGQKFEDTPAGLLAAIKESRKSSSRHVRVAHVVRHITIVDTRENKAVPSQQEIAALLAKGNEAINGIKGLMCNEGFLMSFDPMAHSPTRVTISFNAVAMLGKCPIRPSEAKRSWNEQAIQRNKVALDDAEAKLKAAGIRYTRSTHEIVLKP